MVFRADPTAPAAISRSGPACRATQDVRFDRHGNVWLADRGYPHRLLNLDPRTGAFTDYVLPDPKSGIHEVNVDPQGIIWVPEHRGVLYPDMDRIETLGAYYLHGPPGNAFATRQQ